MIHVDTVALREAIARARLLAGRNSSMPIYSTVMLTAKTENAWLTITAASAEAMIALDVDADDIGAPLSVCVDADRFALALNAPGEKTRISLEGERVKIATGKSVFRLPHQPAEDFPILLSQGERIAAFDCEWLGAALRQVLPFCGDAGHPRMDSRGVSLKGNADHVKVEATTGSTCGSLAVEARGAEGFAAMLPRRSCEVLAELAPTKAILKGGSGVFLGPNFQITTTYLQGVLADTDRVFPPEDAPALVVARKPFIEAAKMVAAVSDVMLKRTRPVRIECDGLGTMVISAIGKSAEGRADLECEGLPYDGTYDSSFLVELAECSDDDNLTLRTASAPARIATTGAMGMRAVATSMRT